VSAWLDPLRAALDAASSEVAFFFRDDDAGWRDDRLHRLLDVFEAAGAPIDVAAIPSALAPERARRLAGRCRAVPELIRVHQHGLAHTNHEPVGRKSEFGPSRRAHEQLADVLLGRRLLLDRIGEVEPIFTPPWNRCTRDTARAVRHAGLGVLSRDSSAEPFHLEGVRELPVSVDWVRLDRAELGCRLAAAVRRGKPTGVMLHHAVMDGEDREGVARLLALVQGSSAVRLATMSDLAATEVAA
jgi:peptidoglycan/xylan/chitin deacetylase (PgdA/CDA1 family)